jgi:hypothetical protein
MKKYIDIPATNITIAFLDPVTNETTDINTKENSIKSFIFFALFIW